MTRSLSFSLIILALQIALGLMLVWLLIVGSWLGALIVVVFFGLSFVYLLRQNGRPTISDVLFALGALICAVDYRFGIFLWNAPYDKITHAYMTLSASLAFLFLFYGNLLYLQRAMALATSIFTLGMTLGVFWEIFEWMTDLGNGWSDTITDLIADGLGALVAVLVAILTRKRGINLM